jgi:hypothetical protein
MEEQLAKCKALIQSSDPNNHELALMLMNKTLKLTLDQICKLLIETGWLVTKIDIAPRGADFYIDGEEPDDIPLIKTKIKLLDLEARIILFCNNNQTYVSIVKMKDDFHQITDYYASEPVGTYRKSKLYNIIYTKVLKTLLKYY